MHGLGMKDRYRRAFLRLSCGKRGACAGLRHHALYTPCARLRASTRLPLAFYTPPVRLPHAFRTPFRTPFLFHTPAALHTAACDQPSGTSRAPKTATSQGVGRCLRRCLRMERRCLELTKTSPKKPRAMFTMFRNANFARRRARCLRCLGITKTSPNQGDVWAMFVFFEAMFGLNISRTARTGSGRCSGCHLKRCQGALAGGGGRGQN